MSPPQPIRLLGLINLITLKCLCAARIDKLADSNEPAKILFMQSNCKIVLTLIATSHIWEKAVISGLFRGGCTTVDPGFPRMAPILKRIPTYYLTKFSPKLSEHEEIWAKKGVRLRFYFVDLSLLCVCPLCLHVTTPTLCTDSYLCTYLHTIFPFASGCALHTLCCLFHLQVLVPSHQLVVLSCHLFIVYFM